MDDDAAKAILSALGQPIAWQDKGKTLAGTTWLGYADDGSRYLTFPHYTGGFMYRFWQAWENTQFSHEGKALSEADAKTACEVHAVTRQWC